MIRILMNILFAIRNVGQRWFMNIFEKFRGPDGKIMGISPRGLKTLIVTILSIFFLGVIVSQLFDMTSNNTGGLDKFQKEMTPKLGVGDMEAGPGVINTNDPLRGLSIRDQDPLAALRSQRGQGGGTTAGGIDGEIDKDGNILPSVSECLDLLEKMKMGRVLTPEEATKADTCIEQNLMGLSPDELALAKGLLETNIEKAAKGATAATPPTVRERLLRDALSGQLESQSREGRIAELLKRGNSDGEAALAALEAGNRELADALLKRGEGGDLTDRERELLRAFEQMTAQAGTAAPTQSKSQSAVDSEAAARALAQQIAENEQRLRSMDEELARARDAARVAADKLAKGIPLSKAEQDALTRLAELQKARDAEAARQKSLQEQLAKLMSGLRDTLARVSATMQQVYPSGITLVNFDEDDCNKKPLPFKKVARKGSTKKATTGEVVLGLDGKPLTPDKIRLLRLYQKSKAQEKAEEIAALKPDSSLIGSLGSPISGSDLGGEEIGRQEMAQLFVFTNKSLKDVNLTANMKIPAVLDSQILVSDKGGNQVVRLRVLQDIHNPDNNKLVIPKGAIAIARTAGFDPETGIMDMTITKVIVGSGKTIELKLTVGSADGTMGLRGQVRDTRGKYLLGAFVTAFSAGALNWFAQSVIAPFQEEDDAGNALTGASLAGGAEVMQKIAEMYSADLQGAARIFWVPKGVPVILFPD